MTTKRYLCILLCVSIISLLLGCWDYTGLDEMALVAGLAIDIDEETGEYLVTFEILDLGKSTEDAGSRSILTESKGKTIFDAARNAKMKNENKLYFGDALVVIVSKRVAEEGGLFGVIDWFLRDNETREVVKLCMSQMDTAKKILESKSDETVVVSYQLNDIIEEDNKVTLSTRKSEIFEMYNILKGEGICLAIPAIVSDDSGKGVKTNGVAIFNGDKAIGQLSAIETKYFLFAADFVEGGLLNFSSTGGEKEDITLEISKNKTKRSVSYDEEAFILRVEMETEVVVGEVQLPIDLLEKSVYENIQQKAEEKLEKKITDVIRKVQSEYGADIFGFGNLVYKRQNHLWDEIAPDWKTYFANAEVEVSSKVKIINTAHINSTAKK